MSFKKIYTHIEKLADLELLYTAANYPAFSSDHEAYAVILEEVEEAEHELAAVKHDTGGLWRAVKADLPKGAADFSQYIERAAKRLSCEAIQIAAMCKKLRESQRTRNNDEQ